MWTIPGGRTDIGEILETALLREIKEEVGINYVQIKGFIGEVDGVKDGDIVMIFHCETNQDPKLMEPGKFSEWKWVSIQDYLDNDIYSGFNLKARKMIINFLTNLNDF